MDNSMGLVAHVRRTESGLTKMQIQIPISTRAGMAALSKRLGISQLAIVRSALAAYLLQHEPTWQGRAPAPAPEIITETSEVTPWWLPRRPWLMAR
jgi:hypothetical protein